MADELKTTIVLQDGFSATSSKYVDEAEKMEKASDGAAAAMENEQKKAGGLAGALKKLKGKHKAKVGVEGTKTANAQVKALEDRLEKLTGRKVSLKATAKVSRGEIRKAKSEVKELKAQLKDLTGRKYKIEMSGLEGAGGGLSGILGGALGGKLGAVVNPATVAAAVGTAAAAGAGKLFTNMFSEGSTRQSQRTALTHFLGGDTNRANEMMDWATENAAKTQYGAVEVTQATQRAVQVADGDTDRAKKLVSLAEDMASLNPGKTISDALEALADADVGEMERLTFGLAA